MRIKELDALRGIAALLVVFFHFTLGRPQAHYGFNLGITGVDLFFMISGFVIFMSIQKATSGLEFVIHRFSRLYPTYWTCVSFTALLQLLLIIYTSQNPTDLSVPKYIINLSMFQHYFMVNDIDGSYWTMIIEMLFYISILILFVTKKMKHILLIGLVLLSIIGIYSVFSIHINSKINSQLIYWFQLYSHLPLFLAGIICNKIYYKEGNFYFNYLCLAFCLAVQCNLFYNFEKVMPYVSCIEYIIMLSIFFLVFILFANHKLQFIASKPLLFLGKISFPLYLIHQFISNEIMIPKLIEYGVNFWIASIITLAVCITIATIITYLIEIPLGKKLNHTLLSRLNLPTNHS